MRRKGILSSTRDKALLNLKPEKPGVVFPLNLSLADQASASDHREPGYDPAKEARHRIAPQSKTGDAQRQSTE
jgi:hypothetical protein